MTVAERGPGQTTVGELSSLSGQPSTGTGPGPGAYFFNTGGGQHYRAKLKDVTN